MRLTNHSDYALRVLLYLGARPGARVTTKVIADGFGISMSHLQKVVRTLGELGVVTLHRGVKGGVELSKPAGQISIGTVMRGLEGDAALVECFSPTLNECVITSVCGLKPAFYRAREAFFESLDPVTLHQIVAGKSGQEVKRLTGG
jgi:Rrf2 family nitric oxide-sensitive transcriptional repressor